MWGASGERYPVLALVERLRLSALIFPAVFFPDGDQIRLGLDNPRILAVIIAGLVSWRSKNLLLTIMVGMVALRVLQMII